MLSRLVRSLAVSQVCDSGAARSPNGPAPVRLPGPGCSRPNSRDPAPPHAVDAALRAYRDEGRHLVAAERFVDLVDSATGVTVAEARYVVREAGTTSRLGTLLHAVIPAARQPLKLSPVLARQRHGATGSDTTNYSIRINVEIFRRMTLGHLACHVHCELRRRPERSGEIAFRLVGKPLEDISPVLPAEVAQPFSRRTEVGHPPTGC